MEAICCGNMKAETASAASRRRGRSNDGSLLLASELAGSDAARAVAYGRISRSRSCGGDQIGMKKNRALTFLVEVFSRNYMGCGGGGGGSIGVDTADEAVVQKKKKEKGQPCWLPDPHRRWPVQGW